MPVAANWKFSLVHRVVLLDCQFESSIIAIRRMQMGRLYLV